jgi:hypothetical protein
MTDERSEQRLREWFASAASIEEPATLHAFLAAVPVTHPQAELGSRRRGRHRLGVIAAVAAALATATALAVVGARLLETSPGPSRPPASGQASPNPSASESTFGAPVRIGEQTGTRSSLAITAGGPAVVVSAGPGRAVGLGNPTGGPCPASSIGSIGLGSIQWSAAPGAVLEIAGSSTAGGPLGLGLSGDCSQSVVAVPDGSGRFTIVNAPNPMRPDAEFLAVDPLDPTSAASWVSDANRLKGGFISWTGDGGRTWQSQTAARPVGWDDSGTFWTLADDGELIRSAGPGFSGTRTGIRVDVPAPAQGVALDLSAVAVFRDRILVAPRTGGLQTVSTTAAGSNAAASPDSLPDVGVLALSAGSRFVAAVTLDAGGQGILVILSDGRTFRRSALPPAFSPTAGAAAVQLLALDDRVILSDSGPDGVIGIWSIAVTRLPSRPPEPSAAPTPTIPSAPPPRATSTWTTVRPPPVTSGGATGGRIGALPTGGFIDFVTGDPRRTLVYASTDGSSWGRVSEITGQDPSGIAPMVAFDGRRYVALGFEGGGQFYGNQSNGAAWVSSDFRRWTKAPVQDAFAGAEFGGIAAGPGGFVATGFDNGGQAVWRSADGLTWTVVNDLALPRDSTYPSGIVFRSGRYLMVGRVDQAPAVWTSADGRHWATVANLPERSGFQLQGLADGPAGLVTFALGAASVEVKPGDFRGPVVPWISDDGSSWRAGPPSAALFGAYASIVAAPGGYVAAGAVGDDPTARLWTSRDGLDWVEAAGVDLGGSSTVDVVSDGRHVIVVGAGSDGNPVLLVSDGVVR